MGLNKSHLITVFDAFDHSCTVSELQEFSSGHINDTYLISTENEQQFVLQRINAEVFKNVPELIANKV